MARVRAVLAPGRLSWAEYHRQWRAANPKKAKAIRRRFYAAHPERARAATLRWIKAHPERMRELQRQGYARHPDRQIARSAVSRAVREGKVLKPDVCQGCGLRCGRGRLQGHHHNGYAREHWYDVVWLCRACHVLAHHPTTARIWRVGED